MLIGIATAGCFSIPDLDISATPVAASALSLVVATADLTAAQTQKLIARLSSDEQTADAVQRHMLREGAIAGGTLTAGNSVTLWL
jgi:hypothetical protein